ncbi:ammonium transporter [Guillardia theta CCMP2712]|uniref:Ammonium transporter n=1 Tax=Guillardia theta (strain CCMP2712) TaxID=905079 RepID=L1J6T2_GUITC|nr:ammonium transporter [Guillardia theta CCMP2712]EKX44052.1 ammonium transporter [Guillardia theta CCMP2712]|eukprot:XP_005831032.1 ammonium transporter [Guillardia theta CCMP2712]
MRYGLCCWLSCKLTIDAGSLVFFMQAGFAMLEAGVVNSRNVINILYKNIMDASIGCVCFWLVGYGFAYGTTAGGFIGTDNFAISSIYNGAGEGGSDGWEGFFFQFAFAGTAATIVSGSVAERFKFEAYLVYSGVCTAFIYPVIVHWVWGSGFLSAWGARPDADGNARPLLSGTSTSNGVIDFAGSGVVHLVGGVSGLMGAILVGPRKGRFDSDGKPKAQRPHNTTLMALGTTILWFGWYGFNCGSTLALSGGAANVAGKVAVTTTISAAAGCLMATIISRFLEGTFDIGLALNGILAALVGITANCSVVNPWMAFLIGIISAWIYYGASKLLLKLRIDDPLDAFPIHGACGFWGLLATGIFCTDANVQYAAYPNVNDACGRGEQFAVQLIGGLVIVAWASVMSGLTFLVMKFVVGLRVSSEIEEAGLDISEHGIGAYANELTKVFPSPVSDEVTKVQVSYE